MIIKMHSARVLLQCAALAALTSGCATMSKDECLHADWYLKGVDDATQGYALSRVDEHREACARVNVEPNVKEYREGHRKGERLYCVPAKGYSEGVKGAAYNNICPVELEAGFLRAYRDGQELYRIQHNINEIVNLLQNNHATIDRKYDEIAELKRDIVNSQDPKERREKMRRVSDLERDIANMEYNSNHAAQELDAYRNDLRIVEDKHYRMGYIK